MNTNLYKMLDKYNIQTTSGCIEPGYDDKPVALANWSNIPEKVYKALEFMGYSCEWEDEWLQCDNCYKSFRSSPDSYGWEMYGHIFDGFALCGDCIEWDELLESYENNPRMAVTTSLFYKHENEITSRYSLVTDDYQNGFHEGMSDNPKKILAKIRENDKSGRYIFVITEQSQFYITFAVYKRKEEEG
jgi:hypothetical protein